MVVGWGVCLCRLCMILVVRGEEVLGDEKDSGAFREASSPANDCELFWWEREEGL